MKTVTRRYKVKTDTLRELMADNGLTQSETAELCGLGFSTLKQTLSTSNGTVKTIGKLADGLGVNPKNIAIFPRGKKRAAEAVTPAADTEQVCIEDNYDDTISDSKSKGGKLYLYDGALQDGKRLLELVPEETILEALVAHLQLPVAEVRWL